MKIRILAILLLLAPALISLAAQSEETETFTSSDGNFTFEYPADWFIDTEDEEPFGPFGGGQILLTNVEGSLLDSPDAITVKVALPRKRNNLGMLMTGDTPAEMVANISQTWAESLGVEIATPSNDGTPQPLEFQGTTADVVEFTIDGRPAAYAYMTSETIASDILFDIGQLILIADMGDDYWVSITAESYNGGVEAIQHHEMTILEIAQSMQFTAPPPLISDNPDLPEVFSGDIGVWQRGSIEFSYPEDWYISTFVTVMVSNQEFNSMDLTPKSGQFIAAIQGVSETIASVDPSELSNFCTEEETEKKEWTAREIVTTTLENITPARAQQFESAGITLSQPEAVIVNDVEIVYFRVYQEDLEVLAMYIDLGDGYVPSMEVYSLQGEMAQYEATLFEVASTFKYTPKPCEDF